MSRTMSVLRRLLAPRVPRREDYELVSGALPRPSALTPDDPSADASSPSDPEAGELRRIAGPVPWPALLLSAVEFAERASYYGAGGVFANFVQRPLPPGSRTGAPVAAGDVPGAMGLGLRASSALTTLFTMLAFASPLFGGWLADTKWGRLRTIGVGTLVAGLAHATSLWAAAPATLTAGTALVPFLMTVLLLGGSAGLIKANIAPLMAEQVPPTRVDRRETPGGHLERVTIDGELTVARTMGAYYASINAGAFFALSSVWAEQRAGFWLAFALPGAVFLLMPPLLWYVRPLLRPAPAPSSSAITTLVSVLKSDFLPALGPRGRTGALGGAEGEVGEVGEVGGEVGEGEEEEVRRALKACGLFAWFAVYNAAPGLNSLTISLAGSMAPSVPNDALDKLNPLAILAAVPALNALYARLAARGVRFGPVRRVVAGFLLSALGAGYLAALQAVVYASSPCGARATDCAQTSGISNLWVAPGPVLQGVSEALAVVSGMELAYTQSPAGLKSIVTAVFLFMVAASGALVLLLLPLMRDPFLVLPYAITAAAITVSALCVHRRYAHLDDP